MDFTLGQTQQAVAEAAAHVLGRHARGRAVSRAGAGTGQEGPATDQGDCYDRALWKELGQAGLLGLAVPGPLGGEGLGVAETAVLLTEAGRAAADVPALATLAMGVLPVTRWGSRDQQQALLAGMDVSYPLHRYSALVKDLVNLVGGADYRLSLLGDGAG